MIRGLTNNRYLYSSDVVLLHFRPSHFVKEFPDANENRKLALTMRLRDVPVHSIEYESPEIVTVLVLGVPLEVLAVSNIATSFAFENSYSRGPKLRAVQHNCERGTYTAGKMNIRYMINGSCPLKVFNILHTKQLKN